MSDDGFGQDFPGAPQQVDFWSLEIPPNKTVEAKLSELPGLMEIAHVTTVALGEAAKAGRHVVKVIPMDLDRTRKPEVAIGTLELGRTDQFSVDFGFSSSMAFRHTGKSSVFLSGYMTRSYGMYGSESDDEYESGSESESEDEEAPAAVPLLQNGKMVVPVLKGAAAPAANGPAAAGGGDSSSEEDESEEEEEGESDEEGEDEDMMGDEYDRRLGAKSFGGAAGAGGDSDSSGEEEGEEEGESDDDDPLDIDSDDLVAGIEYADVEAEEDDEDESSDEGEEDEDEEEEEDDSSDEPEQLQQQQQPAAKGKRSAPPMTPQPQQQAAKKQKGAEGRPVSASAPAKGPVAKTAAAGGDAAASAYVSALVSELKKSAGSSLPLSTLASKVKKPAEVSAKFKAFLVQHADTFTINGDTVGLVKK